jgi:hypothetical protein
MRSWISPRRVVRFAALSVSAILVNLTAFSWLSGAVPYSSLRVGMPEEDATAIMEANGYEVIDGEFRHFAVTEVYSRNKLEPPIVLVFRGGVLTYKERACPPDYFLQSLCSRLRGSSR